jgi:hypothetical protein
MSRYVEANENLVNMFYEVLHNDFPGFTNINFKLMFDTKKRIKKGKLVMASTELVNEKIRFFSSDADAPEGYDYLIIVDEVVWEYAGDDDKRRLMSHELNHVFIDEKGRLKIIDHDIEDFMSEIKKNEDKPEWAIDLAFMANTVYEQDAEAKK